MGCPMSKFAVLRARLGVPSLPSELYEMIAEHIVPSDFVSECRREGYDRLLGVLVLLGAPSKLLRQKLDEYRTLFLKVIHDIGNESFGYGYGQKKWVSFATSSRFYVRERTVDDVSVVHAFRGDCLQHDMETGDLVHVSNGETIRLGSSSAIVEADPLALLVHVKDWTPGG